MDREHLMALAKDAGLPTAWISDSGVLTWTDLEHFAALVAAHEREECAKVAKQFDIDHPNTNYGGCIANLIRSRT